MSARTSPSSDAATSAFIQRISRVLGRAAPAAPPSPPPQVDERITRVTGLHEDLPAIFAARATGAGMKVHRTGSSSAGVMLAELLVSLGVRTVGVTASEVPSTVTSGLEARGITQVRWEAGRGLDAMYDLDAGITGVESAIAETGTLVCSSGPGRPRGLSLVPPLHVALVRKSQIVADLIDHLRLSPASPPAELSSSTVFITGPSKTADIEGVLITGVHGPREVHILLIDDA